MKHQNKVMYLRKILLNEKEGIMRENSNIDEIEELIEWLNNLIEKEYNK